MGLYERDYGRPGDQTPWDRTQNPRSVTIILIVINVVVFFSAWIFEDLTELIALYADTPTKPWMWWQLLTYGFAHDQGGPSHILFNMIGLFFFGRAVERKLGQQEFLKFYLIAILVGGLAGIASYWVQGSSGSIIGASGAVVATTILFACFYPNSEVLVMFAFPMKAWVIAVAFVAMDLSGALGIRGESRTAFEVHLGGAGFALLYYFRHWNFGWIDLNFFSDLPDRVRKRSRRMKLKLHDPDRKLLREAEEADRILAKIHESGESSLTASERKTLERYSRRQREKRGL